MKKLMIVLLLSITAAPAYAQPADTAAVKALMQNAPDYFHAPDMPRFALIGKERKFYLGIGGYVNASVSYDLGNPMDDPLHFIPAAISMTPNDLENGVAADRYKMQMSAGASSLFFNFVSLPHTKNKIGAYVNFDFSGNGANYGLVLKSAYLTYKGFTFGYKPSLFTDGAASPPVIDQQGPNSMTFLFNTLLNYQYVFNGHWEIGVGMELPEWQKIPDIPFYGQYSWKGGKAWIRLSGLIRNIDSGSAGSDLGYGVKLSGSTVIGRKFKMSYQTVYGKGIGRYVQDLHYAGMDRIPDVEVLGSYTTLVWMISSKLFTSATMGGVECFSDEAPATMQTEQQPPLFDKSQYVAANIFYNITPTVQAGIEYLWGSRKNKDGAFSQNTRIQSAVRVNF